MAIGYLRAKKLMVQLDWKMRVTMEQDLLTITKIELYHPKSSTVYSVRRDSGKKLMAECRVCSRKDDETAILCYDHGGSDEDLI